MSDNCPPNGETSQLSAKETKSTPKSNRKPKPTKWDKKKQNRKEESLAAKEQAATSPMTPQAKQKNTKGKAKVKEPKQIHNKNEETDEMKNKTITNQPPTVISKSQSCDETVQNTGTDSNDSNTKYSANSSQSATSGSKWNAASIEQEKQAVIIEKTISTETESQITEKCKEINEDSNVNDIQKVPSKHVENKTNDLGSEHFEDATGSVGADSKSGSISYAIESENNSEKEMKAVISESVTDITLREDSEIIRDELLLKSLDAHAISDSTTNMNEVEPTSKLQLPKEETNLNGADITSDSGADHDAQNSIQECTPEKGNNKICDNGPNDCPTIQSSQYSPINHKPIHSSNSSVTTSKSHSVVNICDDPTVNNCIKNGDENQEDGTDGSSKSVAHITMNGKEVERIYSVGETYTCAPDTTYTVLTSEDDRDQISSPDEIHTRSVSSTPMTHHANQNIFTIPPTGSKNKKKKNKKGNHKNQERSMDIYSSTEFEAKKSPGFKYTNYDSNQKQQSNYDKSISPYSRPNSASDSSFTVTPLNVDTDRVFGRGRGIEGANNSCYMDSTLFSLFYATDAFDDRLLTEIGSKGLPNKLSKEVRSILKDSIVYPLRQGYYCPRDNVWKLRNAMKNLNGKLCGSFMDAEEFIFLLFEDALNVNEFLHYTTGTSDFMHQIIIDYDDKRKYVNTQNLFEVSMKSLDDLKLQSVPEPALILEMPRSNRLLVNYSGIVPNVQLDLNNVMVLCALDNSTTDIEMETSLPNPNQKSIVVQVQDPQTSAPQIIVKPNFPKRCFLAISKVFGMTVSPIYRTFTPNFVRPLLNSAVLTFFRSCVFLFAFFVPLRVQEAINYLIPTANESGEDSISEKNELSKNSNNDIEAGLSLTQTTENVLSGQKLMDLIAVICIRGCHYTSFVKYAGVSGSEATWLFFDSMAGGGPEVEEVLDCEKWLRKLEKAPEETERLWDEIPWAVKRIITDCHICIYKPTQTALQRVSTESFAVENEHEN